MQTHVVLVLMVNALLAMATNAKAQAACRVEPFQGATTPQGAVAYMTVANSGASCSIANYGVPAGRINPSESGSITSEPVNGSASFVAPHATYLPASGFTGDDEFAYEAFAKGNSDRSVRMRVRVKVRVVAP